MYPWHGFLVTRDKKSANQAYWQADQCQIWRLYQTSTTVAFLDPAFKSVALASDTLKVIVRHVAPVFPYLALELLPVASYTVPIRIISSGCCGYRNSRTPDLFERRNASHFVKRMARKSGPVIGLCHPICQVNLERMRGPINFAIILVVSVSNGSALAATKNSTARHLSHARERYPTMKNGKAIVLVVEDSTIIRMGLRAARGSRTQAQVVSIGRRDQPPP